MACSDIPVVVAVTVVITVFVKVVRAVVTCSSDVRGVGDQSRETVKCYDDK